MTNKSTVLFLLLGAGFYPLVEPVKNWKMRMHRSPTYSLRIAS